MKYRVSHVTDYRYNERVPLCHTLARLRPREFARQGVLGSTLRISPQPASWSEAMDYFGNHVAHIAVQQPHDRLTLTAHSRVEVRDAAPPREMAAVAWEAARDALAARATPDGLEAAEFAFASPMVQIDPAAAAYAQPSLPGGRGLVEAVDELAARIHADFRFEPGGTAVGTPVARVLEQRSGVCQDFAHVMIACLRGKGLAARYVSGYLLTEPPAGQPRLVGADVSHAWVSVWHPGFGWWDVDPTNNRRVGEQHVTLAWGRDYDDVAPVRGVVVGSSIHTLEVRVDVAPL